MAVNDCFQVNVCQLISGVECTNSFYYYQVNASALGADTIAAELNERFFVLIWGAEWAPRISKFVELSCIWTRRISPTKTLPIVQPYVSEFGSQDSDPIPNGSCVLMSLAGGTASFVVNNRRYFSGLSTIHQDLSALTPLALTGFRIFAIQVVDTRMGPMSDPGLVMAPAAFSFKQLAAMDPTPFEALLRSSVKAPLRSQRGRNLKGSAAP